MTGIPESPRQSTPGPTELMHLRNWFAHFARKVVPEPEWSGPGCRWVGVDPRVYLAAGVVAPWRGPLPESCAPTEEGMRLAAVGVAMRRLGDAIWKFSTRSALRSALESVTTTAVVVSTEVPS